ncbi:MUTM homolog-1 isoform X2 [Wolffia australiana]
MPELPEVEAARRAVEDHCAGKRILRAVIADDAKVVVGVPPTDFEASLTGKIVVSALRKGKNLWLQLDSPPFPSFQFGMTGAIHIKGVQVTKYKRSVVSDEDEWPSKYSKVFLQLDDGLELSFTDKRRFARVRLLQNPESMPPISELGPDALLEPMLLDEFVNLLSSKSVSIKGLLLDQSYIAGIGNWIADEVLYQARIHPLQVAASLTRDKCEKLLSCIKEVVHYAVGVDADCDRFPIEWLFHFRWGKKPGSVCGKKIEFISAGGRTTAFVPELQKLDHTKASEVSSSRSKRSPLPNRAARKRERVTIDRESEDEEEEEEEKSNIKGKRPIKTAQKSRKSKGVESVVEEKKIETGKRRAKEKTVVKTTRVDIRKKKGKK